MTFNLEKFDAVTAKGYVTLPQLGLLFHEIQLEYFL